MQNISITTSTPYRRIDDRNHLIEDLSSMFVTLAMNSFVCIMFFRAYEPFMSIVHKIKNMIMQRIGAEREQRIQDTASRIQNYLRNSNKKVVCYIALDVLIYYMMLKTKRLLMNMLITPAMLFINKKCFAHGISDDVIKNLGYLDSIATFALVRTIYRVKNQINEIIAQRNEFFPIEPIARGLEIEIGAIEGAQDFIPRAMQPQEIDLFRDN